MKKIKLITYEMFRDPSIKNFFENYGIFTFDGFIPNSTTDVQTIYNDYFDEMIEDSSLTTSEESYKILENFKGSLTDAETRNPLKVYTILSASLYTKGDKQKLTLYKELFTKSIDDGFDIYGFYSFILNKIYQNQKTIQDFYMEDFYTLHKELEKIEKIINQELPRSLYYEIFQTLEKVMLWKNTLQILKVGNNENSYKSLTLKKELKLFINKLKNYLNLVDGNMLKQVACSKIKVASLKEERKTLWGLTIKQSSRKEIEIASHLKIISNQLNDNTSLDNLII